MAVMENLSVDEDGTMEEDGDEAVLYTFDVYN